MINKEIYKQFVKSNHWVSLFYPNRELHSRNEIKEVKSGFVKRSVEKMLGGKLGEWMDEKFLKITLNRWKKKFPYLSETKFDVDFRSRKNVSKHHPQGFQHKVSDEMEKRKKLIFDQSGIVVPAMRWEWNVEESHVSSLTSQV